VFAPPPVIGCVWENLRYPFYFPSLPPYEAAKCRTYVNRHVIFLTAKNLFYQHIFKRKENLVRNRITQLGPFNKLKVPLLSFMLYTYKINWSVKIKSREEVRDEKERERENKWEGSTKKKCMLYKSVHCYVFPSLSHLFSFLKKRRQAFSFQTHEKVSFQLQIWSLESSLEGFGIDIHLKNGTTFPKAKNIFTNFATKYFIRH
jgi:hypothetical protein